jgi:hypothetical protein
LRGSVLGSETKGYRCLGEPQLDLKLPLSLKHFIIKFSYAHSGSFEGLSAFYRCRIDLAISTFDNLGIYA